MVQKFGLEIPALTEARAKAELAGYNQQSRKIFDKARAESAELLKSVEAFLEKHDTASVSGCSDYNMFGVITSDNDPTAPCGIPFHGTKELAQAVAKEFPANRVFSRDGEVIEPPPTTVTALDEARRKRRLRPGA